jgi:hypothetical protein
LSTDIEQSTRTLKLAEVKRERPLECSLFVVNGRYKGRRLTGVERYAHEITKRFHTTPEVIAPSKPLKGLAGHLWEQAVLPVKLNGQLLWSPCNTGPLAVKNQIVTIHDVIALDRPEWFNPNFVRLYRELLPRLVSQARHILTVSNYSKQRVMERFRVNPEKITVTAEGVGEEFNPRPNAKWRQCEQHMAFRTNVICLCWPHGNLERITSVFSRPGKS